MPESCSCSQTTNSAYISAIVLGLNDALVELTGALAGFTMVLQNCRLIFLAGFTTGLAATLSMAAAEFLSQQAGNNGPVPWKAALYTGIAYLITVVFLLIPFAVFTRPLYALLTSLMLGALLITIFSFFEARMRQISFRRICTQMLVVSFGVAAISFFISWLANYWWGISL